MLFGIKKVSALHFLSMFVLFFLAAWKCARSHLVWYYAVNHFVNRLLVSCCNRVVDAVFVMP